MKQMKELIRGIVIKNQDLAYSCAACYYLMRTVAIPINSWVWVYNPRASPPEGDKLENKKLCISWAGPYLYEGMQNSNMAKIAKVDEAGQVVRKFLVHGSKVRLCHWGGQEEDDQELWKVRPGLLPDFPDSEVSAPLRPNKREE